MEPENQKRIESIKQWILLQRDKDGWENTKTTAEVFLVLLEDELQAKQKYPTDYTASVSLTQKLLANWSFNAANAYGAENTLDVPVSFTPAKLTIEKKGTGRLYYNSLVTYFRHLKPGDQIAGKSLPEGLQISRRFFRLVPAANKQWHHPFSAASR